MSGLDGLRIALTRTPRGCAEWIPAIREAGAKPVIYPCIRTDLIGDGATAGRLREALGDAHWLALSSATAVRAVVSVLDGAGPGDVGLAVVGPATARECHARFGRVDLEAGNGTGNGLASDLAALLQATDSTQRTIVVTAAADDGGHDLEEILEPLGVTVRRVPVYRTTPAPAAGTRFPLDEIADVVLLASPSSVQGLVNLAEVSASIRVVTIGPTTTAAAVEHGLEVAGEATERSVEGMLAVLS